MDWGNFWGSFGNFWESLGSWPGWSAVGGATGIVIAIGTVVLLGLTFALVVYARRDQAVSLDAMGQQVERAVDALGVRIERDLAREAVFRQITHPAPVMVRWSSTGRPAASRDAVLGTGLGVDWRQMPLEGDVGAIVEAFRDLPHRQLMVLGEPGAGKSALAMLLTLGLIRRPQPGQPVPVLLAINGWDPNSEDLDGFVVRQLVEDYGDELALAGDVAGLARRLVDQGRVLPVLDGLDELPAQWHARAVDALDRFAAEERPLVATCRGREYERAVTESETVLARAAVVEIEPVGFEAAIAFLSYPELARARWAPVFAHLRQHPHGHLARALSSPLMVAMARTAYTDPRTNPADLLLLPMREAIIDRLMSEFVTAVYTNPSRAQDTGGQALRAYSPERAARWLACLAYHLYQAGTCDLHWWQLKPDLLSPRPRRARIVTIGTAVILATLVAGLLGELSGGVWVAGRDAVVGAIVMGGGTAGLFRPMWPGGYPPRVRRTYGSLWRRQVQYHGRRLAFGIGCGLLTRSS